MRRIMGMAAMAAVGLIVAGAAGHVEAQQADGWWEWALPHLAEVRGSSQDVLIPLPRGDQRGSRANARANAGPPFCQNGQGHPVHGRQWCRDKGFGTGGLQGVRWDDRRWDDVILRAPRGTDRRRGAMDQGGLMDVLGDIVFGRIVAERSLLGARAPLTGRWAQGDGAATVLQIRAGDLPIAELTDLNGDGRADAVLIARR